MIEIYKSLGIISIIMTWVSCIFLVYTRQQGRAKSLSLHASSHKTAYILFALTLTSTGFLFFLFGVNWLVPTLHLPGIFIFFLGITFISQLLTGWIPDSGVLRHYIHLICAYILFLSLPSLLLITALSNQISNIARDICVGSIVAMFVIWFLYIFIKSTHKHFLLYQSSYIILFHIAILSVVYIR